MKTFLGNYSIHAKGQSQHQFKRLNTHFSLGMRIAMLGAVLLIATSATAQTFTEQTGANNPFDTLVVNNNSVPTFVDIDNDGDFDAFIGEYNGPVVYFKNIGTKDSSIFVAQTGADNPLDAVNMNLVAAPAFVDIDNDGDFDAFVGGGYDNVSYWKNTGTNSSPTFVEQTGANNPLDGFTNAYGGASKPAFVDIDNDGDLDVFIGTWDGKFYHFENTGTISSPTFVKQNGTANLFNGVDIGGGSAPAFMDIDNDGDYDAFSGEYDGIIYYFENTGSDTSATFVERTGTANPFDGIDIGDLATPTVVDIDDDGDLDVFFGDNSGIIKYYRNNTIAVHTEYQAIDNQLSIFPNPVQDQLNIENGEGVATIYNIMGQSVKKIVINNEQFTIDVNDLPKGQYVLSVIKDTGAIWTRKFIK